MSTPSPNAFIGRTAPPADADLKQALGPVKTAWDLAIGELATYGVVDQEWKSYSPKGGWSLRLKRGKRTIVWLSPCQGCVRVLFILGDKAVHAAREGGVSRRVLRLIDEAERYPEGNGVRLDIKGPRDIPTVRQLAEIKLSN